MNIKEIKLVTWDVDGTLYSLRRMKCYVLAKYLRETIKGNRSLAHRELTVLRRYGQMIDRRRAEGGTIGNLRDEVDLDALEHAARHWYVDSIARVGPRTGIKRLLLMLRDRGIPQIVFSDYEAGPKLKSLGLAELFAAVYVGEQLGFVKPHPAVLKIIAADFAVPIESILHIGDRVDRDEAAAHAAGCRCLILRRDFRDFASLLETLEK
jgi:FMN phosphatase YigB (HAD superfamily)